MSSLKREIPKKDMENHFSEIPYHIRRGGVLVIDATKTNKQRIEEMLNLRVTLGREHFYTILQEAEKYAALIEERREIEKQKRHAINDAQRETENTPTAKFIRALKLKNVSMEELNTWAKNTPVEAQREALAEFEKLVTHRAVALGIETANFGLAFLHAHTVSPAPTPPPQPKSLLERVKEKISFQPQESTRPT